MTTSEPHVPHPEPDETVAAGDPGPGAPEQAPGTGPAGEEPDVAETDETTGFGAVDTPFRTPQPPS